MPPLTRDHSGTQRAVLGAGAPILAQVGANTVTSITGTLLDPVLQDAAQTAWSTHPVALPDFTTLLQLWHRGYLAADDAEQAIKFLGCNLGQRAGGNWWPMYTRIWQAAIAARWHRPGTELAVQAEATGFFDRRLLDILWTKSGAKREHWAAAIKLARVQPAVAMLVEMFIEGRLTLEEALAEIARYGGDADEWRRFLPRLFHAPPPDLVLTLWNRGTIDRVVAHDWLKRTWGIDDVAVARTEVLRHWMPPPQDLILFAVREVFAKDKDIRDALQAEFDGNPEMRALMAAQGMHTIVVQPEGHPQTVLDVPMAYWMAHWHWPSPTQGYEMLHRLRPGRVTRYWQGDFTPSVFDFADLKRLLKVTDHVPIHRDQLAAIAYRPPTRVDIRRMYALGVIDEVEVGEKYLDLGYAPADAAELTRFTVAQQERAERMRREREQRIAQAEHDRRMRPLRRQTARLAWAAWEEGLFTEAQLRDRLAAVGVSAEEIDVQLANRTLARTVDRVRRARERILADYTAGIISRELAEARLAALTIAPERIDEMLDDAVLDWSDTRRRETTAQVADWYRRGLITLPEAVLRLRRLGWSDAEVSLQLQVEGQRIEERIAAAATAAARTEAQRGRAIERQLRAAEAQAARLRARLRSHGTPAQLRKWLKQGTISEAEARERLTLLGWPEADATRLLCEVSDDPEACARGETPPPTEEEE